MASFNEKDLNQVLAQLWFLKNPRVRGFQICTWIRGSDILVAEEIIRVLVTDEVLIPVRSAPTVKQFLYGWYKYTLIKYLRSLRNFDRAFDLQTHFEFYINRLNLFNHPNSKALRQLIKTRGTHNYSINA